MKRTGTTNEHLTMLITDLHREGTTKDVGLWLRLARDLGVSTRSRRAVNISKLARSTTANEVVVVPGKVLGSGELAHSLTVAAWGFSGSAKAQIEKAKGKCITIHELLKQHPKGQNVRIIG